MLDINLIREKPEIIKQSLKKRQDAEKIKWLDDFLKKDKEWRSLKQEIDKLRHKRNITSEEINKLKKENKNISHKIQEVKNFLDKMKGLEDKASFLKEKMEYYSMRFPNTLHKSVPIGKEESDNKVIRKFGKVPKFKFQLKNHLEILKDLGLIDYERAEKVSGRGFFYLKGQLALLDRALQSYAIDFLTKKGYLFIYPPHMLRREPYEGVVDLTDFENMMYKIENEDLYLIATAEHPIGAMFKNEVLNKKELPLKIVGFSTNFRKEVGAHGKYTKGLFRMHQFNKVEQFIFCLPEDSWKYHEELQKNAEMLYKKLGLHFRTVVLCSKETGVVSAKTYDIELWMSDKVYREVGSNSNCTDYQARRLNLKYNEIKGQSPKGFVHTLNNTAIATSRTMVALIEQFQQKDGSIKVPLVLQKYCGFKKLEKLR